MDGWMDVVGVRGLGRRKKKSPAGMITAVDLGC